MFIWQKKNGDKNVQLFQLQSETKAFGQELIYEAKLQNSACPRRP